MVPTNQSYPGNDQNYLLLKNNFYMVLPKTVFTYPFHHAKLQILQNCTPAFTEQIHEKNNL